MGILSAALVLGALGLVFGIVLAAASKAFEVPANPIVEALRECLPSANCGACGYPGCDGYAQAVANGDAPIGACAPGGSACMQKMAEIMGVAAPDASAKMVATLTCQGSTEHCASKYDYDGITDCLAASLVSGGDKACSFACLGLGTCERACPFDAIHVDPIKKIAVVDKEKCQSCEKCVAVCPKHVLTMRPADAAVSVACHNTDMGKAVMSKCDIGCIGCTKCAKACKFGAIEMVNNLPVIDYAKCVECMMCAEVCPTHAIAGNLEKRKIAKINKDICIGCTICKKQCQFDAISGEIKKTHEITNACTGCGACVKKCPKKCISLEERTSSRDPKATAN